MVSTVVHQDGDSQKRSGRCLGSRPVRKESVVPMVTEEGGCTVSVGVIGET